MQEKRLETMQWLKIADRDLESARLLHEHKTFPNAISSCQQAVEKAMKGLFIAEVGAMFPRTHSLAQIAEATSFPRE